YPDFSIFLYLDSVCAAARGDVAHSQLALAHCAANDVERHELESYFTRLRDLSRTAQIDLLDTAQLWAGDDRELLQDVIHLTPRGHSLLAIAISERLAKN